MRAVIFVNQVWCQSIKVNRFFTFLCHKWSMEYFFHSLIFLSYLYRIDSKQCFFLSLGHSSALGSLCVWKDHCRKWYRHELNQHFCCQLWACLLNSHNYNQVARVTITMIGAMKMYCPINHTTKIPLTKTNNNNPDSHFIPTTIEWGGKCMKL